LNDSTNQFDVPDIDLETLDHDDRSALLKVEFLKQTAKLPWAELQTYYARGNVIVVAPNLDLVDVAVQLGLDNTAQFEAWIEAGEIGPATDQHAITWHDEDAVLWVTVAAPWVLVQRREEVSDT